MQLEKAIEFLHRSGEELQALLTDVPDTRWAEQPAGVRNHPAWTVPHLCCGLRLGMDMLGLVERSSCPVVWRETTDIGTLPVDDRSVYPSGKVALETYLRCAEEYARAVRGTDPVVFDQVNPVVEERDFYPTIGHGVLYILLSHTPMHLGQLIAWKRAAGLVPVS